MAIKVKLDGWDELLDAVRKAEGDVDREARKCIERSAEIVQEELKAKLSEAGTDGGGARLAKRMPAFEIEGAGDRVTAHVGFVSTAYDPDNLSDYYKAMFMNYGTPARKSHGQERAWDFIKKAKRAADKKIKTLQEESLANMTRGLTNK